MAHRSPFVLAGALALMSCSTDSGGVETSDFDLEFTVVVTDSPKPGTELRVYVTSGVKGITLADGDELHVVTDKDDDLLLQRDAGVLDGFYKLELPGRNDITEFTVELRREEQASALGTVVTIPGALALADSPAGKTYAVGDTIPLTWSNPVEGTTMYVTSAPCDGVKLDSDGPDPVADSGALEITVRDLIVGAPDAKGSCTDVWIERAGAAMQTIDPGLHEDSMVEAHRTINFRVTITP